MRDAAPRWSGLLVSVRDAAEATEALAGGAAIIDVKEPLNGPLGRVSIAVAADVAAVIAGRRPWTMACGELAHAARMGDLRAALPPEASLPAAVKAGPSGLSIRDWETEFARFAGALPPAVEAIAVAYADWHVAASPRPEELIAAAAAAGCRTLLLDTCDKSAGRLLEAIPGDALRAWIERAKSAGMAVAVAGRLDCDDIAAVVTMGADVVAVRSVACRGGRLGRVDRRLVAAAVAACGATAAASPAPGR